MVWPGAVEPDICDYIISEGLKLDSDIGVFGNNSQTDENIRSSIVGWFNPNECPRIMRIITDFVSVANRTNFGVDISYGVTDVQFSSYSSAKSGRYEWHYDTFFDATPFQRKLSFCLQLSDPSTYEGGRFETRDKNFDPDVFLPRGSVLIFPSFLEHRVTPVTSGVRHSLVSWIEGTPWR